MPTLETLFAESDYVSIFLWALVLIVFLLILFVAVVFLKRWLKSDDFTSRGPGFTLSDLRQLVVLAALLQIVPPNAGLSFEREFVLRAGTEVPFFAVDEGGHPIALNQV